MRKSFPFIAHYFISLYGTLSINAFILYGYLFFSQYTIKFPQLSFLLILIAVMNYSLISHRIVAYHKKLISFVWASAFLAYFNEIFNLINLDSAVLNIIFAVYALAAVYISFVLMATLKTAGTSIVKERSRLYPHYNYIELVDGFVTNADYSIILLHYDMFKISKDGIILSNKQCITINNFQNYLKEYGKKYDSLNQDDIDVISMINI